MKRYSNALFIKEIEFKTPTRHVCLQEEGPVQKRQRIIASCGKKAKQRKPLHTVSGSVNYELLWKQSGVPRMFKNLITIELTNLLEYTSKGNTNSILKRYLHFVLLYSTMHNSQNAKHTQKKSCVHQQVNKEMWSVSIAEHWSQKGSHTLICTNKSRAE